MYPGSHSSFGAKRGLSFGILVVRVIAREAEMRNNKNNSSLNILEKRKIYFCSESSSDDTYIALFWFGSPLTELKNEFKKSLSTFVLSVKEKIVTVMCLFNSRTLDSSKRQIETVKSCSNTRKKFTPNYHHPSFFAMLLYNEQEMLEAILLKVYTSLLSMKWKTELIRFLEGRHQKGN